MQQLNAVLMKEIPASDVQENKNKDDMSLGETQKFKRSLGTGLPKMAAV